MAMSTAIPPIDLSGKRVTVMGLGSFGGGLGAVQFLLERRANITITDLKTRDELSSALAKLDLDTGITLHLGRHIESDFINVDLIVVNPAVPPNSDFLQVARQSGVATTTEMNLFWQFNRGRTVGVTGSNGKSTTTALIHGILEAAGHRCWLGGNIGRSLLPHVDDIQPQDWVVLELSSFQLEDLDRIQASPHVAVVTNFSPNHLDRHGTLDDYRFAKQTILRWQDESDIAVLNADDPDVRDWNSTSRRFTFGTQDDGNSGVSASNGRFLVRANNRTQIVPLSEWLHLPGEHNLHNAMAATCATMAIGIDQQAVQCGLERFSALPHRLQFIAEADGRRFYNDSLATTPESAIAAIRSFDRPIVLLAGGYDKQVDLSKMADAIATQVKVVALMGTTGPLLEELINKHQSANRAVAKVCTSFSESFDWAVTHSAPGDVILLSPGSASYDWFENFADRGEQFAGLVQSLRDSLQVRTSYNLA